MTHRLPDYNALTLGELYFAPNPETVETELEPLFETVRYADAAIWTAWSGVHEAEVWKLAALTAHIDPQHLAWQDLAPLSDTHTAPALFLDTLAAACKVIDDGGWPCDLAYARRTELKVVRVADFRALVSGDMVCVLPALFPSGGIQAAAHLSAAPASPARELRTPRKKSAADEFLRQQDLIPALLPFSAATLWRKVKSGEFPQPVKLSAGITAWRREAVNAWLKERETSKRRQKP